MEIEKRITKYNDDSYTEIYHKKGDISFYHREDGPAYINYDYGLIECEAYWVNGKRHREDGPAYIEYNPDGSIKYEQYWVNHNNLTKKEFNEKYPKKVNKKDTLIQLDFTIKGVKFTLDELKQLQKELNKNLK